MKKYLLTDSFLAFMREKFLFDIYEDDFKLFENSIENNESFIVDETKRNLSYNLQNESDIEYYNKEFQNVEAPNSQVLDKLREIINVDENFNFLDREIQFSTPVPIPFIIATAIVNQVPVVVDETHSDYLRFSKICKNYNIKIYNKNAYIKELRESV